MDIVADLRISLAKTEVFSPGFAVYGRAREASLQVSVVSRPSAECLLPGACPEGPRWKSLTTRCRPGQRRRSQPSTGTDPGEKTSLRRRYPPMIGGSYRPMAHRAQ